MQVSLEDYSILIVEDNTDDVLLIKRAFQQCGVVNPLRFVTDGEQAVAYLKGTGEFGDRKKNPLPVLILLDLKMPRMNGFEFLRWLRNEPDLKKIIVVILTSSSESPDINRAYELGANSYLVKPVRFEDLIRIVKELHLYWLIMNEKPDIKG
ncbi:MAG TPA: response regulator [Nitrospirae bacterium]|nr:response regulator [Nitrospirota bacterium]